MGQEIQRAPDSNDDMHEFQRRLREETSLLMHCFQDGRFASCSDGYTVGLELETWLVDQNFAPLAENKKFLAMMSDKRVVPELSKFNAEVNVDPALVGPGCLNNLAEQLRGTWQGVQAAMGSMDGHMLTIGTLPTLRDSMLTVDYMSDSERYRALNEYVLAMRRGKPMKLSIEGRDHLQTVHHDIMLEAASTSFQVHIQPPYELMTATFNASLLASAASVALAANSPYLFGSDLWDDTRIAVFEQAVCLPGCARLDGTRQQRVTFGSDYVQESLLELFLENTHGYPVLLPIVADQAPDKFYHTNLQNSTIWRWNRPVLGFGMDGSPSLRVEHRVMSAGPTIDDMVANLAFVLGLCQSLARTIPDPHLFMPFKQVHDNFYASARDGLKAQVYWGGPDKVPLQNLILDELLPAARDGLKQLQISEEEIAYYLDHIVQSRVANFQTGASWQRQWVAAYGRDFKGLTAAYFENQEAGRPVHTWKI